MSDRGETQEAAIVYVLAAKFAAQKLRIAVRAPFGHHTWMRLSLGSLVFCTISGRLPDGIFRGFQEEKLMEDFQKLLQESFQKKKSEGFLDRRPEDSQKELLEDFQKKLEGFQKQFLEDSQTKLLEISKMHS